MNSVKRQDYVKYGFVSLICVAVLLSLVWYLFIQEREWKHFPYASDAASGNYYLASQRWLEQHGHKVQKVAALNKTELSNFKSGTLIYGANDNSMTPSFAQDILAWVKQGNTLILRPTYYGDAEVDEVPHDDEQEQTSHVEELQTDPISAHFGVGLKFYSGKRKPEQLFLEEMINPVPFKDEPELVKKMRELNVNKQAMYIPGLGYNLNLKFEEILLINQKPYSELLLFDQSKQLLQVHAHGKGRVIFTAASYFDNDSLNQLDHAQLLLHLVQAKQTVYIVHQIEAKSWWQLLWQHFYLTLMALTCLCILWFWRVKQGFGSILPEPNVDRRAVLEHIRASGRWMWKSSTGRQTLLAAMRTDLRNLLQRRAVEVMALSEEEQILHLAQAIGVSQRNLRFAYLDPVAKHGKDFTLQIKILKLIRTHYER
jgi:hypothetical protein